MPFKLDIPLIHLNEGRLPRARAETEYLVVSAAAVTVGDRDAEEIVRHSSVEALDDGDGWALPYLRVGGKVMRPFDIKNPASPLELASRLARAARLGDDPVDIIRSTPLAFVAPSLRVKVEGFQLGSAFLPTLGSDSLKTKNISHDGSASALEELQAFIDTDMAMVDGNLYVTAPEPTWQVAMVDDEIRLSASTNESGLAERQGMQGRAQFNFTAAQHDDALAFARRCSEITGRPLKMTGRYRLVAHEDDAPLSVNPVILAATAIVTRSAFTFALSSVAARHLFNEVPTADSVVDIVNGMEENLRTKEWFMQRQGDSLAFFDAFRAYMEYVSPRHLPDDLKPISVLGGGLKIT